MWEIWLENDMGPIPIWPSVGNVFGGQSTVRNLSMLRGVTAWATELLVPISPFFGFATNRPRSDFFQLSTAYLWDFWD